MFKPTKIITAVIITFTFGFGFDTPYGDHFFTMEGADSLLSGAVTIDGIVSSGEGDFIKLADNRTSGYIILAPRQADEPYNRGLPSWNGTAVDNNAGFKVFMRFPYGAGWSSWMTVGYWKDNIWPVYGATSYGGGEVDIDYVKLDDYQTQWQFKLELKRTSTNIVSPTLRKLNFSTSDRQTTLQLNYSDILNDDPPELFIPTTFLYQYSLDPNIGGSICSPTTVCMILESYEITVAPVAFAWDTYDPHYGLFGVWPRVVQNASEYGLVGAVTRYRSWSEAYSVLAQGGRIAMSVSQPLYSGHLMMLAGFDSNGNPIVHDPARTWGYNHVYPKSDISHSWFDKGGIGYTFYLRDSLQVAISSENENRNNPGEFCVVSNYPNPFNAQTTINVELNEMARVAAVIFDINGRQVRSMHWGYLLPGPIHFPGMERMTAV